VDTLQESSIIEKKQVNIETNEINVLKRRCRNLKLAMFFLTGFIILISIIILITWCGLYFLFIWVPLCGSAFIALMILLIFFRMCKKKLALKEEETDRGKDTTNEFS